LFLSSFPPVSVLKSNKYGVGKSARFRKTLVVLRFSLSILLIIGMGVVLQQINYMKNKNVGFDKEQLIYLPLNGESSFTYRILKEQLIQNPRVLDVTGTDQPPTWFGNNGDSADWDGKDPAKNFLISSALVDFDYTETLKIPMVAGRTFSQQFATDNGKSWLVNEEIVKLMGLTPAAAVGKRFRWDTAEGPIVGVMKNFHVYSIQYVIPPLVAIVSQENVRFATVRLKAGEIPAALEDVKKTWQRVNSQYPFESHFFNEDFDQMYRSEDRFGSLLTVFFVMAIIIACLGLFGLASFMAEQRTKEIGVRKTLGATTFSIVRLLSREFVRWVLIANLLAWPIAYYLMHNWLQDYAYRISLGIGIFVLSGFAALLIALLTVIYQAIRAARQNPVKSLRYE
jgi:putative ABC transport system permease protein